MDDLSKKPLDSHKVLFLKGGTVLNVYSGEILEMNVITCGDRIWAVTPSGEKPMGAAVLDVTGKVLVPGYVEPHFHPWFLYNPVTIGEEACRLGTTTLFCDNLIFYMLKGVEVFEGMMEAFSKMPIKYYWFCRAVPQTPMVGEEVLFSVKNLKRLLENPHVQSLGEITRWPAIIEGNPDIVKKIALAKHLRKRVDGHTAGARFEQLVALAREGIDSCHEATTAEEALDRLRLGFYVMLRESSLRRDLKELLKIITENRVLTNRLMLTSDSSTPSFYREFGFTDHLLRLAMEKGIDPISAYRMVTLNPATYFGMDGMIGGIAPGRSADILVLKDLHHPSPEMVISRGRVVAENGSLTVSFPRVKWHQFFPPEIFPEGDRETKSNWFEMRSSQKTVQVPVIKLINPVITRVEWVEFETPQGFVDVNGKVGLSLCALLDRERRWITNGIIDGFGEVDGLASSFNTAAEILVIGRNPDAMRMAVDRVLRIKGGVVVVENGEIVYEFPLPIGGIGSDRPITEIAEMDRTFLKFLAKRGYAFHDPFYTLVFLPNDFLPQVRITYRGVIDIKKNEILWPRRDLNHKPF